jgi:hypothetical protein
MSSLPLGLSPDSEYAKNEAFVNLLKQLESERLEQVIQRLISKSGYTEKKAREARIAFLRFISLTQISASSIAPIPIADDFWHEFILFTKDYFAFCGKHFGRYIHHQPNTASQESHAKVKPNQSKVPAQSTLHYTLDLLGKCYGDVSRLKRKYL